MTTNPQRSGIFTSEFIGVLLGPGAAALLSNIKDMPQAIQMTLIICATVAVVAYGWFRTMLKTSIAEEAGVVSAIIGAKRNQPTPGPVAPTPEVKGYIMRKSLYVVVALAILAGAMLASAGLGGCVSKPGSEALQPEGLQYRDPSQTHSTAQLGLDGPTQIGGPLSQETSLLSISDMRETNGGGAAKQRLMVISDARGFRATASSAANLNATVTLDDKGNPKTFAFTTDNAAVQRAANEGIAALVAQWTKATESERAVLEAQIKAQAETGNTVAQSVLTIIAGLK
jgi:hypothetical protein